MSGRSIDVYGPAGVQARRWRRLLTEIQMTWHEHPVNQARAERQLPPINSLWLDGRIEPAPSFPFAECLTDLDSVRGLAQSAEQAVRPGEQRLLALLHPQHAQLRGDSARASAAMTAADTDDPATARWQGIARVMSALDRKQLFPGRDDGVRHIVLTGERRTVELQTGPFDRWQVWRRLDSSRWFEGPQRDL